MIDLIPGDANPYYLAAFVLYMLLILGLGVWGYTRTNDVMDFWVFGQDMGPTLATWSLIANFVSSVSVIGFIGSVYVEGYSLMTHTILGLMLGISGLYFVVGRVRALNVLTLPDLIAEVSGYDVARPISGSVLLANAWLYLIMQLVGASLLITAITGVPYEYMVWVIGAVFIIYTVLGGLVSVAWTDLVQGVIMVAAVAITFVYMLFDLGSFTAINAELAAVDSALVHPTNEGTYTALMIAATIVAFFGSIFTEQNMLIRIAATRDIRTAKIHLAGAGAVLSIFYSLLIILGGATTVALLESGLAVDDPDAAFPVLITDYVSTGIGVVIILAVMSAILSTTDTRLHSTGITTARDIYSYFKPDAAETRLMTVSRIATVVFGISATAAAVDPPGTIIELYNLRAVLLTSAFLVPVYVAMYWSDLDGRAIVAAVAGGGILGLGTDLIDGGIGAVPSAFIGIGTGTIVLLVVHHLIPASDDGPDPTGGD
ncbi:sodium:solute symporter family protein [Natronorubrum daqingense]|uniref:Na+:solute symporter n=1 Tax=Natronorubrum daqingense TaxID=588898 RepID=A0A1N6ZCH2_9EURY|nr:Na+:solute symporter [Natronorubrum daqingense]APX95391.1 Na+:solute symporter [Natronorubrum daqingense]SIR24503.1 sodium/proline symporter [Natronorubrum daqingense]